MTALATPVAARRRASPHTGVPIRKPSLGLALTEGPRALSEMARLPWRLPRLFLEPRGDGHPVLLLPGFLTSDLSTYAMRNYLRALGYETFPWQLGRNLGIKAIGAQGEHIRAVIEGLSEGFGGKVSLVGWSLGGIIARQMAREMPERIRQVITLGSPFTGDPRATNVTRLYELLTGDILDDRTIAERLEQELEPLGVPTTAIFSRSDGVTAWENCLEPEVGETRENVEVRGSHMGMTINPAVWRIVANRLSRRFD